MYDSWNSQIVMVLIFGPQYVNIYIIISILYGIPSKLALWSHLRNEQCDRKITYCSKIVYTMFFSERKSPAKVYQSADDERSVYENTVGASSGQESKQILGRFLGTWNGMKTPDR